MSCINSSVCKLCRRENTKLFLKGDRCFTDKCSFERRPYPPGQHGMKRKKLSDYSVRLIEKQNPGLIIYYVTNAPTAYGLNFLPALYFNVYFFCHTHPAHPPYEARSFNTTMAFLFAFNVAVFPAYDSFYSLCRKEKTN